MPDPPAPGWRLWIGLIGPGVVLAGTSIGSGEWLFGPAVTAQYGASLLWLASISIGLQVFCNLMMMRYTVYCGEPIIVGGLRSTPGPRFWILCYVLLDLAAIWPYNASNAAVPLAAAILNRLPGPDDARLVAALGYMVFLLSFVPLIFGGTVYRMLEKIMTIKLVLVLGYLSLLAVCVVSTDVVREVGVGFLRFGNVPLRPDSIVVGRHFTLKQWDDRDRAFTISGTIENSRPVIAQFQTEQNGTVQSLVSRATLAPDLQQRWDALLEQAQAVAQPGTFAVEVRTAEGAILSASGTIGSDQVWQPRRFSIQPPHTPAQIFSAIEAVPEPHAAVLQEFVQNRGLREVGLWSYTRQHGRLPPLDWAMLAAFCAIAGAGGLSNTLFSNYARDKGWGMGGHVGAIPSAIGGRTVRLSHVGMVFDDTAQNRGRWRGWMRHILRDQVAVWMVCSFVGMALPCMISLEFIRNATVQGHRVAAMTAAAMADRHPSQGQLLWTMTLLCGFLVLAPGQISACDQISRRWTDIIWTTSPWAKRRLAGGQVRYIYYSILTLYGVWGLVTLSLFNPLTIAKIGAVLGNVALAFASLHALHTNRSLLPPHLRPHWALQLGVVTAGLFFLSLSAVVVITL